MHFNVDNKVQFYLGFPGGSAGKESTCSVGDLGSIPGLGRCAGEGNRSPILVQTHDRCLFIQIRLCSMHFDVDNKVQFYLLKIKGRNSYPISSFVKIKIG